MCCGIVAGLRLWPTGSSASWQRSGNLCWLMDNSCIDLFKRYSSCHSFFSSCYSTLCADFWLPFPLHFWNSHNAAANSFHLHRNWSLDTNVGVRGSQGGFCWLNRMYLSDFESIDPRLLKSHFKILVVLRFCSQQPRGTHRGPDCRGWTNSV